MTERTEQMSQTKLIKRWRPSSIALYLTEARKSKPAIFTDVITIGNLLLSSPLELDRGKVYTIFSHVHEYRVIYKILRIRSIRTFEHFLRKIKYVILKSRHFVGVTSRKRKKRKKKKT